MSERFRVERWVAAGGMGDVYRALALDSGEPVALKLVRSLEPEHAARFAREEAVLRSLSHPGIVRWRGAGTLEDGRPWLAMEWLEGETLAARLARAPLEVPAALALLCALTEALCELHARGLVHRDLKPSNVLLEGGDPARPRLLDFGLAREHTEYGLLTRAGVAVGTPGYMAPEQARGDATDPRTDVFALGCIAYECLAGRAAFSARDPMALLARVLFEEPPRLASARPELPLAYDALLRAMLRKSAEERPAQASDVLRALAALPPFEPGQGTGEHSSPLAQELRYVSVVLLGPSSTAPEESSPTLTSADPAPPLPSEWARRRGARCDRLAGGYELVVFGLEGQTLAAPNLAARYALAARSLDPGRVLVVATGRATLHSEGLAGEVLDRAVELHRAAREDAPSGVLLDDASTALLASSFVLREAPSGRWLEQPRAPSEPAAGRAVQLVGRARELAALGLAWEQCLAESSPACVLVLGAAGLGKSRLLAEFLSRARQELPTLRVWSARGDVVGAGAPLGLLGSLLEAAAAPFAGEDPLAEMVRATAPSSAPSCLAALREVHALARGLRSKDAARDAQLGSDRLRVGVARWLREASREEPLLLVLDDLHWADAASARLLEEALLGAEGSRLFVLGAGRPELEALGEDLWRRAHATRLSLGPLSRKSGEALLRALLQERAEALSRETFDALLARAQGNAFFLEELSRAALAGEHERAPDSVLALAQARLAALAPELRRTVRAASVLGARFTEEGVRALLGGWAEGAALRGCLEALERSEVLCPEGASWSFRHALLQQAAYAMLPAEDVRASHRRAAEYLEARGGEPLALGSHLERAGEHERAATQLCKASQSALGAHDLAQAESLAQRARALGPSPSVRGALAHVTAEVCAWQGRQRECIAAATEALGLLEPYSEPWCYALGELLAARARVGEREDLEEHSAGLRARIESEGFAHGALVWALLRVTMCWMYAYDRAEIDRCFALLEGARAWLDADAHLQSWELRLRATHAHTAQDLEGYFHFTERALEACERVGDRRGIVLARLNRAHAWVALGLWADARADLEETLPVARALGLDYLVACGVQNSAALALGEGRAAEAYALAREAAEHLGRHGDRSMQAGCYLYASLARSQQGAWEEAEALAEQGLLALSEHGGLRLWALATRARARLGRGALEEALRDALELRAALEALGGIEEGEGLARWVCVEALLASGREAEAREALEGDARWLRRRAEGLSRERWRRGWLEGRREHAALLALEARLARGGA